MRVRLGYWDSPILDPCGTTLGEVEDYPVMISNNVLSTPDELVIEESDIHISPNPTSGQIQVASDLNKIIAVKLFDVRGRLILEKSNKTNELSLNLDGLSNSIYIISIDTEHSTIIKKIVKE
jgi:aminopeptidase YwaD